MSWNFVRRHKRLNQTYAIDFSFDKQKSFNPKKIWSLLSLQDSAFATQQMAPWYPNFPNPRLSNNLYPVQGMKSVMEEKNLKMGSN